MSTETPVLAEHGADSQLKPPVSVPEVAETPFKIAIPDSELEILQQKLALTIFPDELEDSGWDYGAPLENVKRLIGWWRDGYDWRKHEADLNRELPQFVRDVEVESGGGFGVLNVHYVHRKSEAKEAIPLLFVHGWPGCIMEVRKILPLLVEASPDHPSFHVVAPHLPGFGFSSGPTKRGFALEQYAEVCHKLMLSLGYDEYVTQGGDWGSIITETMAHMYGPKHLKARHTNFPLTAIPSLSRPLLLIKHISSYLPFFSYSAIDKASLEATMKYRKRSGYFAVQSTEPQNMGYMLSGSPLGLIGWIYPKLVKASDNYDWIDDEVLTWLSIYYFSRAGPTASIRIYYEVARTLPGGNLLAVSKGINVPTGHSYFAKEVISFPRRWYRTSKLVFEREHESGGHFAAYERPAELVDDLRTMFSQGGGAWSHNMSHKLALASHTFPDELEDAGWAYGVPLADVKRLVHRWQNGYDWRKHENELNEELPQFVMDVPVEGFGTLEIHYVHKKSELASDAIPLLFVHGWPGSFLEIRKMLPLLVEVSTEHPSFHVVAVGLPGFGFSSAPTKKSFGLPQYAEVCNKVMVALGYNEYVTQGGDWGQAITATIASQYGGKHSKAWHTNYLRGVSPPSPWNPLTYLSKLFSPPSATQKAYQERYKWFMEEGRGYSTEQSTQPQTLGYSLADSPVGLLAWIWEKLRNWSDSTGLAQGDEDTTAHVWTEDEVLTWVSIYWFSRAGPAASLRIYYEVTHLGQRETDVRKITIPVGLSTFPKEILIPPRSWLAYNKIVFYKEHTFEEGGGHFAAYERPALLADDLRTMFGKGGGAYEVVSGKTGYAS